MADKKKKILRYILIAVITLVGGAFALNFLLNQRLARFLEKALVERTLNATDGLYHLSFDSLYIGLFSGELHLEGIKLIPDSGLIAEWKAKDLLPPVYADINIGLIEFKGVNLVWRRKYKSLYFSAFEIHSPEIRVFQSGHSQRVKDPDKSIQPKELYEMISPYISVLTVQTMNLENASVIYTIRDEETPIVYALDDVTFHAHGFRLDENSSSSGKLLYCDDFDFTTNQAQTLLANNDFVLSTENITLDTQDSIIHIGEINLAPQKALWEERGIRPQHSLEGNIESVDLKGILFKRENSLNYLTARSFSIHNSSITGFNLSKKEKQPKKSTDSFESGLIHADSLIRAMSLYEITSPLLNSISIDRIGVEKAELQYTKAVKEALDVYLLDNFDFIIREFVIDSASSLTGESPYYKHIDFDATGIRGVLASRNQLVDIRRIALESEKERLHLDGFEITPLSEDNNHNTFSGKLDTVSLQGVDYDEGINAHLFSVSGVDLDYYKSADTTISFQMPKLRLEGLRYQTNKRVQTSSFHMESPHIRLVKSSDPAEELSVKLHDLEVKDFMWNPHGYNSKWKNPMITGLEPEYPTDSLIQSMPIYKVISSLLDNISINRAGIGKANLHYTIAVADSMDVYSLDNFNFEIRKPAAHSVSSHTGKPRHYDIMMDATGIRTVFPSLNQSVNIKRIALNTEKERLHLEGFEISPLLTANDCHAFSGKMDTISLEGVDYHDGLKARRFHISGMDMEYYKSGDTTISLRTPQLLLEGLGYQSGQRIQTASFHLETPDIRLAKNNQPADDLHVRFRNLDVKDFSGNMDGYNFGWIDMRLSDLRFARGGRSFERSDDTTRLTVANLFLNKDFNKYHLTDLNFTMADLSVPVSNGFYTVNIDRLELKNRNIYLDGLHLVSPYPKMEFSYEHPAHKDWFDIRVGNLEVNNIDIEAFTKDNTLRVDDATITDMILQNFKNQKIILPRQVVPMVYEGIQKAPIKLDVPIVYVNNLTVEYDELARNGDVPGKLAISEITGTAKGLTNIVSSPEQFIELKASARFMRTGLFHATWLWPVDSLHDQFLAQARLERFNLVDLNEFIHPLANVELKSGFAHDVTLYMDASGEGGNIRMQLPYKGLKIEIQKKKNEELEKSAFTTFLANAVVKTNNPSKPHKANSKLRESDMVITRDPYHSTFNYLWQLMRPAMAEAAGFSEKTQNFGKRVVKGITNVKNFFTGNKRKEENVPEE